MATEQNTAWTEFFAPDEATTDRGWFKALCEPYDSARYHEYTDATMPVYDEDIKAWREQSTLGNYLDYGPCRPYAKPEERERGLVHCVCYLTHESQYVRTVAEAREWIEQRCLAVRPSLVMQGRLFAEVA